VRRLNLNWRARFLSACLAGSLSLVALFFLVANRATTKDAATNVVKDYIRATYARDFTSAYRLISDKDKPKVSKANSVT
jgi:hypothetical protein